MDKDYDKLYKILMIGEYGVGKSSILLRFCNESFIESYISTIGVDFKIKTLNFENVVYKLQIWDTAGQERFRTITSSYYRGADGILLIYDVTDRKTFNALSSWCDEINRYIDNIGVIIIGNKIDVFDKRIVEHEEARIFAEEHNYGFVETSARNNYNINDVFYELIKKINSTSEIEKKNLNYTNIEKKICCH